MAEQLLCRVDTSTGWSSGTGDLPGKGEWCFEFADNLLSIVGVKTSLTGLDAWENCPYVIGGPSSGGSGVTNGDKGDVTVTGAGTGGENWTVDIIGNTARAFLALGSNSAILSQLGAVDKSNTSTLAAGVTVLLGRDATTGTEAVTYQQLQAAIAGITSVQAVQFATTANVNLAGGGLANGTTHDTYVAATGDPALVWKQTNRTENGLYSVPASGAATRLVGFTTWTPFVGLLVFPLMGTQARTLFQSGANPGGTLGTTNLDFALPNGAGSLIANNNLNDVPNKPAALVNLGALAKAGDTAANLVLGTKSTLQDEMVIPATTGSTTINPKKQNDRFTASSNTSLTTYTTPPALDDVWGIELVNSNSSSSIVYTLPAAFDDAAQLQKSAPTVTVPPSGRVFVNMRCINATGPQVILYGAGVASNRALIQQQYGTKAAGISGGGSISSTGAQAVQFALTTAMQVAANTLVALRSRLRVRAFVSRTTVVGSASLQMYFGTSGDNTDSLIYSNATLGATTGQGVLADFEIIFPTSTTLFTPGATTAGGNSTGNSGDMAAHIDTSQLMKLTVQITATAADTFKLVDCVLEHIFL